MKKSGLLDNLLLLPFGVLAWALEHWIITLLILFALPWGLDQVTEDHLALKRNTH